MTYPTDMAGTTAAGRVRTITAPWDGQPDTEALREVLASWCRVNGLAPDRMLGRDRIEIHPDGITGGHEILWREVLPVDPAGRGHEARTALRRTPLLAEPEGVLAGELTCGHTYSTPSPVADAPTLLFTCDQGINPANGRHPGTHTGGPAQTPASRRTGTGYRMSWPNQHPGDQAFRDGLPYTGDMTPDAAHAMILARLTAILDRRPRVNRAAALIATGPHARGLAAIATRHAPRRVATAAAGGPLCEQRCAPWPCPNYRDALAGIVSFPVVVR